MHNYPELSNPIGTDLLNVLKALPTRLKSQYVFTYKGAPIKDIKRALMGACKRAGIPDGKKITGGMTFHDIRHNFNTNMRKAGVTEDVIMAMTVHATREMFARYNKIDMEDIHHAADRMEVFLESVAQIVD